MVGGIGFWLAQKEGRAKLSLLTLSIALIVAEILVVRNGFGLGFVGAVALISGLIALKASPAVSQLTLIFLSTQMALSVFSRGDYLFTAYAQTAQGKMPSDVSQMAEALVGPYWLWGIVCGVFSLFVLALGLRPYLRPTREKSS